MAKWKCEICGSEFENFHAQGFNHKIYCPLCFFKKKNQELKKQLENKYEKVGTLTNEILYEENTKLINQQKEFIKYLEDEIKFYKNRDTYIVVDILGSYDLNDINLKLLEGILKKYKEIVGVSDEKEN